MGAVYKDKERSWANGEERSYTREKSLLGPRRDGLETAPYFERPRNQYTDKSPSDFIHMKSQAKGDGKTDDTAAIRDIFSKYGDGSKIIYVDSGTYMLSDTVVIPKDAKIVGEAWSQFAAYSASFYAPTKPLLKVGNKSDVGTVEIQDIIVTTKKWFSAGVTLIEWNVQEKDQGSAALWDTHVRVGGAVGTQLTTDECLYSKSVQNATYCTSGALLMHITSKA